MISMRLLSLSKLSNTLAMPRESPVTPLGVKGELPDGFDKANDTAIGPIKVAFDMLQHAAGCPSDFFHGGELVVPSAAASHNPFEWGRTTTFAPLTTGITNDCSKPVSNDSAWR
jgi:hypothetical protein